MKKTTCWVGLLVALVVIGCGGGSSGGVCAGYGGVVDECKDDFSAQECEEWDLEGVNGSAWEHYTGSSCEDLGFGVECGFGTWVQSSDDCG